jgi:hypothetical protein
VRDHFDGGVVPPAFWSQRYYTGDSFLGGEGFPIFLMIGGEGPERAPSAHMFMGYLAEKVSSLWNKY